MGSVTEVKERPIIFSAPMINALLSGRKTQTRRLVNPQPKPHQTEVAHLPSGPAWCWHGPHLNAFGKALPVELWPGGWPDCTPNVKCPYGKPGDHLWVRENFSVQAIDNHEARVSYAARQPKGKTLADTDGGLDIFQLSTEELIQADRLHDPERWNPSIHMPRWASRITLEITDVRVHRLTGISQRDALAEGVEYDVSKEDGAPVARFKSLWNSIHGEGSWERNDWVWAISFRVLKPEVQP